MRKGKVFLLIAMVLVVSMLFGLVAGCQPKNQGPDDTQDPSTGGPSIGTNPGGDSSKYDKLIYADKLECFDIITSVADPNTVINVKDDKNNSVKVDIKAVPNSTGIYRVYPPASGYEMGKSYIIELGSKASFMKHPEAKVIKFVINSNVTSSIKLNNGVKEFDSTLVAQQPIKTGVAEDGVTEIGTMALQTNGDNLLSVGEVFIINDINTGKKEAFKVKVLQSLGAATSITYVKPEFSEVYSEFQCDEEERLNEYSDVDFLNDNTEEALQDTPLAYTLASFFGTKPQFNVAINKVAGDKISAVVSITIPNVVQTAEGAVDLVLSVENLLSATSTTTMNKQDKHLAFNIDAAITNEITCKASISSHVSISKVQNVKELIDKLSQIDKELQGNDNAQVPLFKWIIPVANGAAQVSYQADLVFKFAFSGSFDVEAKTTLKYNVGAAYDNAINPETGKIEGLNAYAKADPNNKNGFESLKLELVGNADVRVGISQEVRFDVLAGVLGLGFQAELGNYNKLYGYMTTNNLIGQESAAIGSAYLDGGFYYDINLNFGLKIGDLINLSKNIDITAGDINGYTAGERYLIKALDKKPAITLNAEYTPYPTYTMQVYDLVTRTTETKDVPADMLEIKLVDGAGQYIEFVNNQIKVKYISSPFNSEVLIEASIKGQDPLVIAPVQTLVRYNGAIVLNKALFEYDKTSKDSVVIDVTLQGVTGTPIVKANGVAISDVKDYENGKITLNKRALNRMNVGLNAIEVCVGNNKALANIDVKGTLSAYSDKIGDNTYEIYALDQIKDIADRSANGETFTGKTFLVIEDIDMNGAVLGQIKTFAGELKSYNSNGATIKNFKVETMTNNDVALFGEIAKGGVVENITFVGDINANFATTTGSDYNIALVATNNGTLNKVSFGGNVVVNSNGLQAYNTINVAGLVAVDNSVMVDCSILKDTVIDVTVKFDLSNVTVNASSLTATKHYAGATVLFKCTAAANSNMPVFTTYNITR